MFYILWHQTWAAYAFNSEKIIHCTWFTMCDNYNSANIQYTVHVSANLRQVQLCTSLAFLHPVRQPLLALFNLLLTECLQHAYYLDTMYNGNKRQNMSHMLLSEKQPLCTLTSLLCKNQISPGSQLNHTTYQFDGCVVFCIRIFEWNSVTNHVWEVLLGLLGRRSTQTWQASQFTAK